MKKKLLTLLTLLVAVCSGAWGDEQLLEYSMDNSNYAAKQDLTAGNGTIYFGADKREEKTAAECGYGYKIDGNAGSSNTKYALLKFSKALKAGDVFNLKGFASSDGYYLCLSATNSNSFVTQLTVNKTETSVSYTVTDNDGLDGKTEVYVLRADGKSVYMSYVKVTRPVTTPTLTGAWKIGDDDVTGTTANVLQNGTANLPSFNVGATSGTPTAANYSVAYSLKEGSEAGIFTYTADGGPTAIVTSNSGTATIVATLTTKDATAFLAPSPNTFEYTVNVSAASAPTIIVTGAPTGDVLVGTEVILTAEATGTPTPTITWYDNAQNAQSVGIGATYTVNTATAGTYQYYAVASNGVGTDATSTLQTIVVKEQVVKPTITPNSAYFETSQEVTLACATEDAAILYSTDGGTTWNTYTDALTFAATTTIQAKATKDGYIDSEVATATFTKFVKTELAEVSTTTTWDWTSWSSTLELKDDGTTTPSKNDTYTYSDIATINNLTLPSGFSGDAITFKGTYPVRSKKSQDGTWTIKVAAPGTLAVTFSDTGNGIQTGYTTETQPKRYLYVNGVKTDYYTQRTGSANDQKTVTLNIAAGENIITTADADGNYLAICLYKLVYTPVTSTTVAVGEKLYRTFASKWPLTFPVTGLTAYKAIVSDNDVTFEEVTGNVPAGEGLLLKANDAGSYTINVPAGEVAPIENALVGVTKETTVDGAGIFVLYDGTQGLGFYKTTAASFTVSANTAYLPAGITTARSFIALDEESTGIAEMEAVKNVENAKFYNLAGQRVAMPTKGMYIVNGKKVIMK